MADFKEQIEDMIGTVGDDQYLADSMNAVAKEIINAMPENKLWAVGEESDEQTSNGFLLEDGKVLGVYRENGTNDEFVSCKEVPIYFERKVQDSNSLFYPSKEEPVFLLKNGSVNVYPLPASTGEKAFKVVSVAYPAVTSVTISTLSTIANFPNEVEHLLILGASARGLQYLMARVKSNLSGLAPSFTAPTFPTISTLSLSIAPSVPSISAQSVSSLGTAPTYSKPSFTAPSFPTISTLSLSTPPSVPSISAQSVSSLGTAPTYSKPSFTAPTFPTIGTLSLSTAPSVPSISAQSVSSLGTAPTYSKPIFVAPTFPTIGTLSVSGAPAIPVLSSLAYSNASKTAFGESVAMTSLGTPPSYISPTASIDTGQLITFLETNEDPELAGVQIERMRVELGKYQADLSDRLNDFNESAESYRADIQKKIKQADIDIAEAQIDAQNGTNVSIQNEAKQLEADLSNNKLVLEKYTSELGSYQTTVSGEVQTFVNNEIQHKFQKWVTEYSSELQRYQLDIQNELNVFNKENVAFQADLQKKIKDAELNDANQNRLLQTYSNEIQGFGVTINAEVEQWSKNEIENKFNKWLNEYSNALQEYQLDIQNELNEFNKENVAYQAELQKKIKDAELNDANQNRLLQKYLNEIQGFGVTINAEVETWSKNEIENKFNKWLNEYSNALQEYQLDIQNELNELNKENVAYQAELQKKIKDAELNDANQNRLLQTYSNEIQGFGVTINAEVETWSKNEIENKFNKWLNEYANKVQVYNVDIAKYNANLQRYNAEYGWYQEQYQRLDGKYNEMLKVYISN